MRLNSLSIQNYRCFESASLDFESHLTVIVAENGQGKSSILDAIRIGMWPFINSFDLASSATFNGPQNSIATDDARLVKSPSGEMKRQLPCSIELEGTWAAGEPLAKWKRIRESEAYRSKTLDDERTGKLKKWAERLQTDIRDPESADITLPVLGYYGTGRLWAQKKLTEQRKGEKDDTENTDFYIRTFAYRNCMDPASSYKHFREWFKWAWQSHANMLAREKATDHERKIAQDRVRVVQGVIDAFLAETTGWNTLEFSVEDQNSLILNHDQAGKMIVDTMSDGIRSMLSMVGDIAYRCVKLNPHLGSKAALDSPGIVLIDEIDMHLHPRWQQLVLTQLKKAFPSIQFIVTTHSPQVLTTVPPQAIRGLKTVNGNVVVRANYEFSEGAEAQIVLEEILGVSARPENLKIVKTLNRYLQLITLDEGKGEEALAIRAQLDEWSNGHEAALIKADMDIRMREFRKTSRT